MADTITSSVVAKFDLAFTDGDTRIVTMKDPRSDLEDTEITELDTMIRTNNLLIGDKNGAAFSQITSVRKITTTERNLDISGT